MLYDSFNKVYTKFKLHFYKEVFKKWRDREVSLTTVETFCMEIIHALGKPTVSEFASFTRIYYLEVTKKYIDYYNISYQYLKEVMGKLENRFTSEENKVLEKMLRVMSEEIME